MIIDKNEFINKLNQKSNESLILNPTENIPIQLYDLNCIEGLYISEEERNENSKVIFAGRKELSSMYYEWCNRLGAADISFKPHSGLDAHISIFMSLGQIGEKVLLLPEVAGGHFSTQKILKRLGLIVKEFPVDYKNFCIDVEQSKKLIYNWNPDYIFIDRSEGLYYEDFSWLKEFNCIKIFDASQYLSNIMAKDYVHPFNMGFDFILSSLHKNYPGPQKAMIATKYSNENWSKIKQGLSIYISNIHPKDVCSVILNMPNNKNLMEYSHKMLAVTRILEEKLLLYGVPAVSRDFLKEYTQHIWIIPNNKMETYSFFKKLEEINILTNYRLLPYNLGYGLRLGTAAAVRQGLDVDTANELAQLISKVYYESSVSQTSIKTAKKLINKIKGNYNEKYN